MSEKNYDADSGNTLELVIFRVGKVVCALESIGVQEIIKEPRITPVYNSPAYVKGVINLRGRIVTIIDMRSKFGLKSSEADNRRIVIVSTGDEAIGLLVDSIDDILKADTNFIEPAPANLNGLDGDFFIGIFKMEKGLVAIINLETVLMVTEFNGTF